MPNLDGGEATGCCSGEGVFTTGGAPTGGTYVVVSLDGTLTNERVLTAGTNITIVDGGPGGNITISATAGGAGDIEEVIAGAGMTGGGASGSVTLNVIAHADGTIVVNADSIQAGVMQTANIADAAITSAKLRNSAALSVIGRSLNSAGVPTDIATTSGSSGVLKETGSGNLTFALISSDNMGAQSVTSAAFRNSIALSVVGRATNSGGVVNDIQAVAAGNGVLMETGSTLAFATIQNANVNASAAIAHSKLADLAGLSVLGRGASSSGAMAAITASADGGVLRRASSTDVSFGTLLSSSFADSTISGARMTGFTNLRLAIGNSSGQLASSNLEYNSATGYLTHATDPLRIRAGNNNPYLELSTAGGSVLAYGAATSLTCGGSQVIANGAVANFSIGGVGSFGGTSCGLFLVNAGTARTTSVSGGIVFNSESGIAKIHDPSGNTYSIGAA